MKTKAIYIIPIIVLAILTISGCKKKGCTDHCAENYDSKAKEDDGSCDYPMPAGTVTSNLETNGTIDFNTGNIGFYGGCNGSAAYEHDLLLTNSLNFKTNFCHRAINDNSCGDPCNNDGGGAVISDQAYEVLGSICEVPTSGFVNEVGLDTKRTYVMKTRNGEYYKIYVVDWWLDTYGGIDGVQIRWVKL